MARRRAVWLLTLSVALILYASFYPFRFDLQRAAQAFGGDWSTLVPWDYSSTGDRLGNLLFYLPLGALAAWLAPPAWNRLLATLLAIAAGAALSASVELLQYTTRLRVPNRVDVVMNVIGASIGAMTGALLRGRPLRGAVLPLRHARPDLVALLLLAVWVATHAWPFMPRLSQYKASRALEPLLALDATLAGVVAFAAGYLVVASAVRRLVTRRTFWVTFGAFAVACLAMRLVFVRQSLTFDEVAGLAAALPVIAWLRGEPRARALRIAAVLVAAGFLLELAWPGVRSYAEPILFLHRAFGVVGVLWLAAGAGWPLVPVALVLAAGVAVLDSFAGALLVILALAIVHAGRLLHGTMRVDERDLRA
jgi:VanZ family protein